MANTDKYEADAGSVDGNESHEKCGNSSDEDVHPGLIDFEEMSKGMNKATARVRKHLHDDTHIYSPTEQFLYKAMETENGRMTRSRTRCMMDATPPPDKAPEKSNPNKAPKKPRRESRTSKNELYSDDDSDEQTLAEVLEKSKIEKQLRQCSRRKRCDQKSTSKSSTSQSALGILCEATRNSGVHGGRRRKCHSREISFGGSSCSKDSSVMSKNDVESSADLESGLSDKYTAASFVAQTAVSNNDKTTMIDGCTATYVPAGDLPSVEDNRSPGNFSITTDSDEEILNMRLSFNSSDRHAYTNASSSEPDLDLDATVNSGNTQEVISPDAMNAAHASRGSVGDSECMISESDSAPLPLKSTPPRETRSSNIDGVVDGMLWRRGKRRTEERQRDTDVSMEKSASTSSLVAVENAADENYATSYGSDRTDTPILKSCASPNKLYVLDDSRLRKVKQSKRSPTQDSVSASSSVVDIVELALSKQQEIENAYSVSRNKVRTTRRNAASKENVDTASSPSIPAATPELESDRIQRMLDHKIAPRRSMAAFLPGPITYTSFQECREEMYKEAVAMYAPQRLSFNPEEIVNAVRAGDVRRFRRATEHFCASSLVIDYGGMIHSVISKWRDENGGTLIHLICRNIKCTKTHGSDDLIVILAKWAPELLRVQDTLLKLPLHIAVEKNEACRVAILLQLGSPICWQDTNSLTPLDIAYTYGNAALVKLLLNSGAAFHELLANEERLPALRRGHLFKMLLRYSGILSGIMRGARKKIVRNLYEVAVLSPVFISPFKDGVDPVFRFTFSPSADKSLNFSSTQIPILFTYLAVNRPEVGKRGVEWSFRCHGPIFCFAPMLNGRLLEPLTGRVQSGVHTTELLSDTFVFLCPLQSGVNVITFKLHESYECKRIMFAAQVVLMRRNSSILCSPEELKHKQL